MTANNNLTTNFNVDPYYDDYDESKNFHRILYRPGFAVQARELTQQQTIMQNQIHRFGNHMFKDGSEVTGTSEVLDQVGVFRIKSSYGGTALTASNFDNQFVRTRDSQQLYKVKKTVARTGDEFDMLFVQYIRSANTNANTTTGTIYAGVSNNEILDFSSSYINANSVFSSNSGTAQIITTLQGSAAKRPVARGYLYSIDESVYYHKGLFIRAPAQTVVVAANNQHAVSVGLQSSETFVTSDDDGSLTDPARGSYNYAAPGADRLKVEMTLVAKPLTSIDAQVTSSNNYVELARIFNGDLTRVRKDPDYNLLADELATRTYEESGNYAVEGFNLSLSNTVATSSNLVAIFSPGTAYVKGYRNRTTARRYIALPKARDTDSVTEQKVTALYGNYFIAHNITDGLPDIDDLVQLHSDNTPSATTKVGEAHIKNIEYSSGSGANRKYKIFLYDIRITSSEKNFNDVRSIIKGSHSSKTAYARVHTDSITSFDKTGRTTAGSATIRLTSTSGVKVGQVVAGSGILANTSVSSISFDEVTLSKNATATNANNILQFSSVNLTDSDFSKSYFAMPHVNVVNVDNVDYKFKRKFGTVSFTSGSATIQTLSGSERFSSGTGDLVNENFIVVSTSAGGGISDGTNLDLTAAGRYANVAAATPGNPQSAVIELNDAAFNGTADIIASIDVTADSRRVKTRTNASKTFAGGYTSSGTRLSLGYADIIKINAIYEGNSSLVTSNTSQAVRVHGANTTMQDVTSKFILDTGQRDSYYDHGTISLKPGYNANTNQILVDFDYYAHGGGLGYFSDKSYPDYTNITTYTTSTGEDVNLRDVLDFRPTRTSNTSANVYSSSKQFNNHQIVDSQTFEVESDYSYYKSVVHKISLDNTGNFVLVTGTPALNNPPIPEHNPDHMLLATFFVNPYTYNEEDMTVRLEDNRRYTMRDIGRIQKRVENLEYYTSLNLLENQVQSQEFLDNEGEARFKSGFLTDSFRGHSVGDVFNPDYKASMDPVNQTMRPTFASDAVPIVASSGTLAQRNGIATLPYSEVGYLDQNIASGTINVNPFQISTFVGSLKLIPSQDHWVDTINRPQITVNTKDDLAQFAALSQIVENQNGYEYGNWEYNGLSTGEANQWHGGIRQYVHTTSSRSRTVSKLEVKTTERVDHTQRIKLDSVSLPYMRTRKVRFEATGLRPNKRLYVFFGGEDISQYAASSSFSSSRVEQVLFSDSNANGRAIVTDDNGSASGYFWVPNKDQTLSRSAYDANPNAVVLTDLSNASTAGTKFTAGVAEVMVCDNFVNPNFSTTFASEFYGAQGSRDTYQTTAYTTKSYSIASRQINVEHGPSIQTGSYFLLTPTTVGQFLTENFPGFSSVHVQLANQIASWYEQYFTRRPEQAGLKYWMDEFFNDNDNPTMSNAARLASLENNIIRAGWLNQEPDGTDLLESRYNALNTPTDSIGSHEAVHQRSIEERRTRQIIACPPQAVNRPCETGIDPLSQTFVVAQEFYRHGVFLTSVDVFIAQKDQALPLTVEIRPTVNGFPSATDYIPMSRVSVNPAQINANATTPTATNIKFDAPIYLAPGEYALVLRTDSGQYLTYIATIGEERLDGTGEITQQPTMGSLFKSQNARTWTPQQESDLCFKLYNASFTKNTNHTAVLVANNVARAAYEANTLFANTVGQYDLANINVGRYDKLEPVFSQYEMITKNKGGSVQPYVEVEPNQNIIFDTSKEITTDADLQVKVTFRTSDSDVSPILNVDTSAVTLVRNIINSDNPSANGYVAETSSSGGHALARYITRKVSLSKDLSARSLKVFVDQNTPNGATVEVYYRVINNDDTTKFEERPFVKMSRKQASAPISDDARQYTELEYFADDITYTQDGIQYSEFDAFVIKIVMFGTSTAAAPSFRNFRAIALA